MRFEAFFGWTLVAALLALSGHHVAQAQDEPAADRSESPDAGASTDADAAGLGGTGPIEDESTEGASEAERIVRIRQVIELDKERAIWLRRELRERTRYFEDLAAGMQELNAERTALEAQLKALESDPASGPEKEKELRAESEELEEDFALFEVQTDLALQAEKTIRKQLEELEKKIEQEREALGRLTGEIPTDVVEPTAEEPSQQRSEAQQDAIPLPPSMPRPATDATPPPETTDWTASSAMTAAQLEAQKILARRQREVEIARQELASFIERKRALQRQIELEQKLEQSDARALENLNKALGVMEARLEKYREQKLPAEKIREREQANGRIAALIEESEREAEARVEYIASLNEQLLYVEEAEGRITAEVDTAVDRAEDARREVKWLESPIHPANIAHWARDRGPRMLLVIIAAAVLLLFIQLSARRIARTLVRRRRKEARGEGTGRADTLAFSFSSMSRVLIVVFAVLLVLQEAGIDVRTVLGGAAILGVAIAFGAQDLMKDYFSGFLILLEDQYQLGDLVTISGITGTVESVNMRVTVLRDLEGRVHFMPNGNIDHVTNRTYAWGRPVFEIPVGFDEDVDRVIDVLVEVARELAEDPDWKGAIIGEPEMLGVDKFTEYGAIIKFMVKTQPDKLFPVRRQMFRRIVNRFRELGIQITVPQRILVRDGPDGEPL